ncbi:ABC-2 type transport system permease protein [Bacilli bacterium PM5-3]|nr:ABC-2 type transport system permease protein [Bacilli bacterium PM5-3]
MIKSLFNVFKRDQQSIKLIKYSKTKKILLNIGITILVLAGFSAMLFPLIVHSDEIQSKIPLNIGHLTIMIGFYLTFVLAIVSSFGFLFSGGYLDKNLNNYIVLPIKKREFVIAKLMLVYYNVLQVVALLMTPCIIIYFVYSDVSLNGILSIIIYCLTMPIITIYGISFLVGTVLYFVNKVKNKMLAKRVLYGTFFVVAFSLYMVFILNVSTQSSEDPTKTITMFMDLISKLDTILFYPGWASELLNKASYINIVYMFVAVVIGSIFLLYFEKVYFKGSIGFNEEGGKTKSKLLKNKKTSSHSMTMWFFIREAKEIFKTGTYFFNSVFGNILIVVVYLAMMGYSYYTNGDTAVEVVSFVKDSLNIETIILVTLVIGTFFTIFNNGAATVFTRDAKVLDYLNTLPLNQSRAFFGKVLFHTLVEFLTIFIFMLIPMLVLQMDVSYIIVSLLVMILVVLATNLIPVCIDLNFPTLDWESETYVVKRSRSVWMTMLVHFGLNALVFGSGFALVMFANVDYKILSYIGIAFYVMMFIVLVFVYRKSVTRAFRKVRG